MHIITSVYVIAIYIATSLWLIYIIQKYILRKSWYNTTLIKSVATEL